MESDADFRARMAATGGPVATGPMTAQARKKEASAGAAAAPRAKAADADEDEEDDLKGVNLRGYKKTSDGRTTSFFNNELDEKAKALIGDITPQAIKPSEAAAAPAGAAGGGSAWNSAGTFEAKNKTEWASEKLEQMLVGVEVSLPEGMGAIKVHALKDLTGDAEVTTMRNKKKYLFDFEFTLEWRGEIKDIGPCKGTLKYVNSRILGHVIKFYTWNTSGHHRLPTQRLAHPTTQPSDDPTTQPSAHPTTQPSSHSTDHSQVPGRDA
mmetsp:Transcript_5956/g.14362  ORF Transcript_5956/g.14362 Transcript_5956/m.14362 type:complete len:267 (+) Transcript_5956:1098-1898(+)